MGRGRGGGEEKPGACRFLDGQSSWTASCQSNERALRDELPCAEKLERLQVAPAAPLLFTSWDLLPERPGTPDGF